MATDSMNVTTSVTIFKNGDLNFRGQRFVVNKKQTRDLDSLCDNVTTTIKPREGCVRNLATPINGTRIEHIDQLEPGGQYVAVCNSRFKKMP